jgi:hypothetical protein
MSYSFNFSERSRADASARVAQEMDRVVAQQPIHGRDRAPAIAAARALIELCPEPKEGEFVNVNMNGSISSRGAGDAAEVMGAGLSAQVNVGPEQRRM